MKKYIYLFETIIFFILIDCINLVFFKDMLGFQDVLLHPYWIPILLIAARYGFFAGFFASICATIHLVAFEFSGIPTRTQVEVWLELSNIILPAAFLIIGGGLGAIRQKNILIEQELKRDLSKSSHSFGVNRFGR